MMKLWIVGFWLAWACLATPSTSLADTLQALEKTIEREVEVLRSCQPANCPVFFIPALDRWLAIPNRFAPRPDESGVVRRYISPDQAVASAEGIAAGEVILGHFYIGRADGLKESVSTGQIKLRRLGSAQGVEIHAASLASNPDDEFAQVLIAGDEYLMISDQNEKLPTLLLELSARLTSAKWK